MVWLFTSSRSPPGWCASSVAGLTLSGATGRRDVVGVLFDRHTAAEARRTVCAVADSSCTL